MQNPLRQTLVPLLAATAVAPLFAQDPAPLIPFAKHVDIYVTDSGNDRVLRLSDLDNDGDYNDSGEVVVFYDDAIGSIALGNNNSIAVLPSGLVLVGDTSSDIILGLQDLDGDGECHDPGEHFVWFDGDPLNNGSGIEMAVPNNLCVDAAGRVFVADADTSAAGLDAVLVLQDRDGDGNANGAAEARYYYVPLNGGSVGSVIPNSVAILPSGGLLYLEGGSTGVTKGLYRLDDLDGDGAIDPLSEVFFHWQLPISPLSPFAWDVNVDRDGAIYVADTGNDVIFRLVDLDGDGQINPLNEQFAYYTSPTASIVWTTKPDEHGRLLVAESQSPDRLLLLEDVNGDGVISPTTEVATIYDSLLATVVIDNPRGLCWRPAPHLVARPNATVGRYATYGVFGAPGEFVSMIGSLSSIAPTQIPFVGGSLEISSAPGAGFFRVPADPVGPNGGRGGVLRLPADPSLVGATLHVQAVVGGSTRRVLTNRESIFLQ